MRKRYLLLVVAVLLCVCLVSVHMGGEKAPMPDTILIYCNDSVHCLLPGEDAFSQAYSLTRIHSDAVQEMAIDPDTVTEVKSALAVEYCYAEPQKLGERSCTRVLFSLSGWTENCAILYRDGEYQSGTYECNVSAKKLTALIENLQK